MQCTERSSSDDLFLSIFQRGDQYRSSLWYSKARIMHSKLLNDQIRKECHLVQCTASLDKPSEE